MRQVLVVRVHVGAAAKCEQAVTVAAQLMAFEEG